MSAAVSEAPRTRIDEAKARFTIPVLWRMFNLRGDPGSPCRSPFREDRSPSFSVFDGGRRWIDHATAERGDAIDFLAKIKGISNPEAFIELLRMVDGTVHQPASSIHRSETTTEPRRGPQLDGIERCSKADLWQLANLRGIPLTSLMLAQKRKLLFPYQDPYQGRCWLVTDDARRSAIYRRLDGKRFHYREPQEDKKEGPKSRNWKGSEANWPIGIAQADGFPSIALCEGAPDFLAAFALAYSGAVESLVAPVCMGGAACSIHKDALPMFRGKRVRIFAHADETGQGAAQRWSEQLASVQADVDGFDFSGLIKDDGSPVKDLNDFLAADHKRSVCPVEIWTGAFDFALERKVNRKWQE
jgi:hypothetical protein